MRPRSIQGTGDADCVSANKKIGDNDICVFSETTNHPLTARVCKAKIVIYEISITFFDSEWKWQLSKRYDIWGVSALYEVDKHK